MDDRAIGILENYELKVLRTWKGRGAILIETTEGIKILKEFVGPRDKVILQDKLIKHIKMNGIPGVDEFVPNKEGELVTLDMNQVPYVVKDYFEGKECSVREIQDCTQAITHLGKLHKCMCLPGEPLATDILPNLLAKEFEKHNRELKKVRNFVRQKGQKTTFEIFLLKNYDIFYDKALEVEAAYEQIDWEAYYLDVFKKGKFCHGDYQYHNIIIKDKVPCVINFEKYVMDSQIKDLYLFTRKVLEKNNWSVDFGNQLLQTYQKEHLLSEMEWKELYFRLSYPEKFWKIVNYYYNSGKAFISERNSDKLEKLLNKEAEKNNFLKTLIPN